MNNSMCSSAPNLEMWIIQGTLAWCTPPVRTRDRWSDSGEIQCTSNFLFTRGIWAVWGGHHGSSLLENPYIPYQCMDSYLSSTGLGSASMGKMERLTTHLHRPRTMRSPQNERGDGGIVPFEPFFHVSIYLSLDSRWEQV
ncbi:unnamed protein product [Victoria cruziana]